MNHYLRVAKYFLYPYWNPSYLKRGLDNRSGLYYGKQGHKLTFKKFMKSLKTK